MTNEELKAAAGRVLASLAHKSDGLSHDCCRCADAVMAAPAWQDKPTCAGMWVMHDAYHALVVMNLNQKACEERMWQRPCFGPIPKSKAT